MAKNAVDRVLSIQSHVVSGYVGNNAAAFPLQVRETRSLQHRHMHIRPSVHAIIYVFSVTRPMPKSHTLIRLDLIPPHSICIDVYSRNEPIDPLHVCGNAAKLEDKTKEICASVKQSYCSVLQIGCILTDVKGVYSLEMSRSLTWNWTTLFRNIKRVTQSFFGWVGIFHIFPNPLWMRRFLQVKVLGDVLGMQSFTCK